ncbi:hypothetical protein [Tuanshanicoccus yangjingiae]
MAEKLDVNSKVVSKWGGMFKKAGITGILNKPRKGIIAV